MRRTLLLAAAVVLTTNPARAQSAHLLRGRPGPFLALSVADIARQTAWYRDTLGFSVLSSGTAPNGTTKFALLEQGPALLEILELKDAKSHGETPSYLVHGFFKTGFVVSAIDSIYATLRGRSVKMAYELGKTPNTVYRSFGVRDPEGNLIQFFGK
jgi:catechol-2,3-dioxygenase